MASRCGYGHDLSRAINDRAMFHADNAYFYPSLELTSLRAKTDTVSNTAFRGFGGPQGMMLAERVMDRVAAAVLRDPLDVRLANLYGENERGITPYGMRVEDNILPELMTQLAETADYRARRAAIIEANANAGRSPIRRGLALTPVRFGISFTTSFLNQAGALIHIYKDGSVQLNHGGTEMGQGLYIKVAQVVSEVLGVDLEQVQITATRTDKVPNTSATAASSGSDLNGWAAKLAALELRDRLTVFWADSQSIKGALRFEGGEVLAEDGRRWPFTEVVKAAYLGRVSLSATGYYRTPKIDWDAKTGQGRPFLYFAYGAAVSEVEIDNLTGANRLVRADILHDVGRSLNPAIDEGQIEGGFIQGMGWLTMEELVYSDRGQVLTHAPSTYKIPCASDRPDDLRIALFGQDNQEDTIFRSKAVGEPPFMLAISVHSALAHAVSSFGPAEHWLTVAITEALGSTPRDAGTCMWVSEDTVMGTIGGGALEHRAIARARDMLAADEDNAAMELPLGPALNQCCGGFVRLSLTRGYHPEAPLMGFPLVLYGGGHVGQALARALEPLPFALTWLDERDNTPADQAELVAQAESGPAGALHYVMTHDHSLDLDIVSALLRRSEAEVPFIGMIGSHTKIARFRSQLSGRGFGDETQARLITPIGISGIGGKEPAVIAAAVAAEALLLRSRFSA